MHVALKGQKQYHEVFKYNHSLKQFFAFFFEILVDQVWNTFVGDVLDRNDNEVQDCYHLIEYRVVQHDQIFENKYIIKSYYCDIEQSDIIVLEIRLESTLHVGSADLFNYIKNVL